MDEPKWKEPAPKSHIQFDCIPVTLGKELGRSVLLGAGRRKDIDAKRIHRGILETMELFCVILRWGHMAM